MQAKHFTPTAAELQPFHKIKCQQPNCDSIFMNMGNYELHLQKRHQIHNNENKTNRNSMDCFYYCPHDDCVYNFRKGLNGGNGRHFKNIKNLRQHFQKVHYKNFICERCGDAFITVGQLEKHATTACGKRLKCTTCNWDFKSKEALLTHCKRKGHTVIKSGDVKLRKINKAKANDDGKSITTSTTKFKGFDKETQTTFETPIITVVVHQNDTQTQTDQQQSNLIAALHNDNETQTEVLSRCTGTGTTTANNTSPSSSIMDVMNAIHDVHDIETQTETYSSSTTSPSSSLANASSNAGGGTFFEHILTQTTASSTTQSHPPTANVGADMHTQTCEAYLLSALGLSDIQTQTNWSSFEDQAKHNIYTNTTSTSTAGFACDELLVSTETQTSFTQCLLESTDMNCGCEAVNVNVGHHSSHVHGNVGGDENASNFAHHLYTTQHTQTCDLLLDGLFGGQENDLIANFQSTYTQT